MATETIDLRRFLNGLRMFDELYPIAQFIHYSGVRITGFSKMKKAELVDAICERLDDPRVLEAVVRNLCNRIHFGEYPSREQ